MAVSQEQPCCLSPFHFLYVTVLMPWRLLEFSFKGPQLWLASATVDPLIKRIKNSKKYTICTHPRSFDTHLGEWVSGNFHPCSVFIFNKRVFIFDQCVLVFNHWVFVFNQRVFAFNHWVLGLRSLFFPSA